MEQSPPESYSPKSGKSSRRNSRASYWAVAVGMPAVITGAFLLLPAPGVDSSPLFSVCGVTAAVMLLAAAYTDIRWRKIPNYCTYPAVLWGLGLHIAVAIFALFLEETTAARFAQIVGATDVWGSIAGLFVLFVLILAVFSLTGGGAGDVKLVAAIGALLGLWHGVDVLAIGFVFAAIIAIVYAILKFGPTFIIRSIARLVGAVVLPMWVKPPGDEEKQLLRLPIPLAPSIALGGLVVLLDVPFETWLRSALAYH